MRSSAAEDGTRRSCASAGAAAAEKANNAMKKRTMIMNGFPSINGTNIGFPAGE
jgi:hypothetical protein